MVRLIDWTQFSADPRARAAATVRASHADRDAALGVLADAFADGRLDAAEHDRRCDAALQAVYLGELAPLLTDLTPSSTALVAVSPQDKAALQYRRELRDTRNTFVLVSGVTIAIWAMTSWGAHELLFFWPGFPMVVLGVGWLAQRGKRDDRLTRLEQRYARREEKRLRRRER